MFGKLAAFPPFFYVFSLPPFFFFFCTPRRTSGNTRPQPGILDQPADLDLIFSTLIINDSPIHQQRSGRPSKASRSRSYSRNRSSDQTVIKDSINTDAINSDLDRPAHLDHSSKIDHPTDRTFLSDFLNHRKPI
ncbi:hypothetical protein MJO28_014018 [Puccinia striiformis f. sp. tritici]|uniref:Uncharacterized protein n=2 Tax=Puccinia striiformis TaxID=27350 RepID=A0A2S4V931_9BASI|nr:hypothetical protein MJO28_014018 [Puccinia striiformis f. sp. tritici]POW06031.1 hypothetical protein PSTT_09296 [Puccinia striiformis]